VFTARDPVTKMEEVKKLLREMHHAARSLGKALRALTVHETPGTAASIAYYSLFALLPATIILIAFADAILGSMNLHEPVLQSVLALFPGSRRDLRAAVEQIHAPSLSVVLTCVVATLWSSTWVLMFVENALNRAWGVLKRRTFWQSRLRSLTLLSLGGFLLLASALLTALVSNAGSFASERASGVAEREIINWLWSSSLLGIGFVFAVLVFFLIYKLMPDRKVRIVEALSGAVLASILWETASYIFAKVVPLFDYQRIYGATGAMIAVMIWVYTSTLIMLIGAHFSAQLHTPSIAQPELFSRPGRSDSTPGGGNVRIFSR
jgi:membrane protein